MYLHKKHGGYINLPTFITNTDTNINLNIINEKDFDDTIKEDLDYNKLNYNKLCPLFDLLYFIKNFLFTALSILDLRVIFRYSFYVINRMQRKDNLSS